MFMYLNQVWNVTGHHSNNITKSKLLKIMVGVYFTIGMYLIK